MNTSTVLPLMVSQAIPRNHTDRHKTHADGANFFHLADGWLARSLALVNSWIAQICYADEEYYILMRLP